MDLEYAGKQKSRNEATERANRAYSCGWIPTKKLWIVTLFF
jgi:hypothetical protein